MSKKNEIEIYTNSYLKRLNDIFNNINYDELTSVIELMLEAFKNNKTVYVLLTTKLLVLLIQQLKV